MEQPLGPCPFDRGKRGAPRPFAVEVDRALSEGDDFAPFGLAFISSYRYRHRLPLVVRELAEQPLVGAVEARCPCGAVYARIAPPRQLATAPCRGRGVPAVEVSVWD